ncbi:MAG: RNA polymerase sigma factor [Acidobacteriota bacterium]|nr:RNA polymerase sigma factor [Acidobacteriota bacterium]
MNGLHTTVVLESERLNEMGLPVHTMTRDGGGRLVEFPRQFEDEESAADAPGGEDRVDADQRDRRFAEMAERNARLMFRVAHGLLRTVQDAEDAVQEALLKLYRTDGWLRMEDEKAFLARTVWRAGLDVVARRPRGTEGLDDKAGREFAAEGESAEQSMVGHDERALLWRLIETLPEQLRQPLVLGAIEEMTSREVAIAMGIPEGTVRTRSMRARAELKRRFEAMRKSSRRSAGG